MCMSALLDIGQFISAPPGLVFVVAVQHVLVMKRDMRTSVLLAALIDLSVLTASSCSGSSDSSLRTCTHSLIGFLRLIQATHWLSQ